MNPESPRRRVVIVGCGFAGFYAALHFGRRSVPRWADVSVIDIRDYHLFTPLLYEAAAGSISVDRLKHPVIPELQRQKIQFRQAWVEAADCVQHVLHTSDGDVPYDYLIVANGSQPDFFGKPDLEEHTLPLKTIEDAEQVQAQVAACIAAALQLPAGPERERLLTFAIVGAGPTGVELAGCLHQALYQRLLPPECRSPGSARVVLLEAQESVLPGMVDDLGRAAASELQRVGVEIVTSAAVESANIDGVFLCDRSFLPAGTVIWTAGVRGAALPGISSAATTADRRIVVGPDLQLPGHPGVFITGDLAAVPSEGTRVPPSAPAAIQTGRAAARSVTRMMLGLAPVRFRYEYQGDLLALGYQNAVAFVGGRLITGAPALLLRRGVYLANLKGVSNRVGLALDWWLGH